MDTIYENRVFIPKVREVVEILTEFLEARENQLEKNYSYCGGDSGEKYYYYRNFFFGDPPIFPRKEKVCFCGDIMVENCYITRTSSPRDNIIILCKKCVKKFIPEIEDRICDICRNEHSNRKDNYCNICRYYLKNTPIKFDVPYNENEEAVKIGSIWSFSMECWTADNPRTLKQVKENWIIRNHIPSYILSELIDSKPKVITFFDVPQDEESKAMALGAKWHKRRRKWYSENDSICSDMKEIWSLDGDGSLQPDQNKRAKNNDDPDFIVFFKVPIEDIDEVTKLGAKWSKHKKLFYVDNGVDFMEMIKRWEMEIP